MESVSGAWNICSVEYFEHIWFDHERIDQDSGRQCHHPQATFKVSRRRPICMPRIDHDEHGDKQIPQNLQAQPSSIRNF
jgi:hypothetical protein